MFSPWICFSKDKGVYEHNTLHIKSQLCQSPWQRVQQFTLNYLIVTPVWVKKAPPFSISANCLALQKSVQIPSDSLPALQQIKTSSGDQPPASSNSIYHHCPGSAIQPLFILQRTRPSLEMSCQRHASFTRRMLWQTLSKALLKLM